MSATLINSTIILNEILALFRTKCISLQAVDRQYDKRFGNGVDLKPGTTLYARKPIQYTVTSGRTLEVQDTVEESVPITCATQIHIGMPAFTSEDLTMKVDSFSDRYLKPAASRMAAELDKLLLQHAALEFNGFVGALGTTPATATVMLQAGQKLNEMNVPDDNRFAIVNPAANTALVNALTGLVNPQKEISGQFRTGMVVSSLGLEMGVSNNIHRVTCGSRSGDAILTDTATIEEGMEVVHCDGFGGATQTIKAGEKFTINGVYAVTPETKINTGSLMQFTVTADFTASGSEGDLHFAPAIRSTGARQNVDALPVANGTNGAAGELNFTGTAATAYAYNVVMHNKAMALVTADLPIPKGVHDAKRERLDGIAMRFLTDYDGKNDEFFSRLDLYYGISTLRRESGLVLYGGTA